MATLKNISFRTVPANEREWGQFFTEIGISDDAIDSVQIADDAVITATINDGAVTLAKQADISTSRIIGRTTAGSGAPEELTGANVVGLVQVEDWAFTQDIGFHGVAASGQVAAIASPTLATISGSGDDANINANFAANKAAIDSLRAALTAKGLTA